MYLSAVEDAFGGDIDYAMLNKIYRSAGEHDTRYSPAKCIGCVATGHHRRARPEARQHVVRGTAESHDADEHAPVHPSDERLQ